MKYPFVNRRLNKDEVAWVQFYLIFGSFWLTIVLLVAALTAGSQRLKDGFAIAGVTSGLLFPASLYYCFATHDDEDEQND